MTPSKTVKPEHPDLRSHADAEPSTDEINRRILRGELNIDTATSSGGISLEAIREWQAAFIAAPKAGRPLEEALEPVWRFMVHGRRKYVTVPVLVLFVLLPGAVSLYDSAKKLWAAASSAIAPPASEMDASELDVCNEWVARVGRYETKEDARRQKHSLVKAMERSEEWTWVDDVHVVRDIETQGKYLLVVDMWSGPSTEKDVAEEIGRLQHPGIRDAENSIGNEMLAARTLYYRQSLFERTYGRTSVSCRHPEL